MKVITTKKDAKDLKIGDQYVIQPEGYDLQKPENLIDFQKEIDDIQKEIESMFTSKDSSKSSSSIK